ncbi:hypothetical protein TTHERM_01123880 (macronuclear) [Tetrahymena thermophila SB210]|uniref:Uncharacterized protein n=1 Tax=Tetrahymena thermophila (strain SB210) TaxID=312017 RepID=Q22B50_TETTS|nr:hypothetical protein TTHERM_01123880 [Tetrahymena thermophila SB210]EAR82505.1 hypothetical protein TTHERM_01123880 [Tetrahymena thermophila SB210]|eukprot:XP_001030168.1 hypothetical protein TTHERM_01123880 [Tetrahymena thermophila SB210]
MIFYLEDNKKWSQLMHFFKTCISGNSNICFMWNNIHGWLLMQNSEYLNNLDSDHLVLLSYFRMNYFSSFINNRDLGIENATFEMDITRIYQSLKSIRKSTKKVMFSLQKKDNYSNDLCVQFVMKIYDEDGILEIKRDVYLNPNLNQHLYFNHMRNLSQENILYLEINQNYLKSVKEFKNSILQLKFYEEHIHVEALNGEQDLVLQINRNICNNYNFSRILSQFDNKNRLLIPPNFLISQIYLANKFNQTIQLQFGDEMVGGRVIVYLRIKNESFEIISAFSTVFDIDNQTQDDTSPFNQNPQQQQQLQYDDIQPNINNNQQNIFNVNYNGINHAEQGDLNNNSNQQFFDQAQQSNSVQIEGDKFQQNQNQQSKINQQQEKDNKQLSKQNQRSNINDGKMIDEQQEIVQGFEKKNNRKMDVEKVGGQQQDGRSKINKQNKNILNSNQFMEVEQDIENINIRKLRKGNLIEMEDNYQQVEDSDYEGNNHQEDEEDSQNYQQSEDENNKNGKFSKSGGSKKRGSVVLNHLQDEFSSIELVQDPNQNKSVFSSSMAIDSRKLTAQQNNHANQINNQQKENIQKQKIRQNNILFTDNELTDYNQTQPQQKYNLKERNQFLTEQKHLQQQQKNYKNGNHIQKNNKLGDLQSNNSEFEERQMYIDQAKNKNTHREQAEVDLEAFNSQIVFPVHHEDMENEESYSNEMMGEYPKKHQKISLIEKRNFERYQEAQQLAQINEENIKNITQKSTLKALNEMQKRLLINNKRTVQDMLQYQPETSKINQNIQQIKEVISKDQLKNKLFNKDERSNSPQNGNKNQHQFAKPAPKQGKNLFDQVNKRNQDVNNYFDSNYVSNQPQSNDSEILQNSSHSIAVKSKLLQRNQENLDQIRKEKLQKKRNKNLKQDLQDNLTQSQIEERQNYQGFLQTPQLKNQKQNLQSSMMSQLHSSQKIIQISNETSESQQVIDKQNKFIQMMNQQNKQIQKDQNMVNKLKQNGYYNGNHIDSNDSQVIDQQAILKKQQHGQPTSLLLKEKGILNHQTAQNNKESNRENISSALNSYNNPLQTNYHSLNTIQTNQSKDLFGTQINNHNHPNYNTSQAFNSAIQRDKFEQYQQVQNRERKIAGINSIQESEIQKANIQEKKSITQFDNQSMMASSNRMNGSSSFKTCLEKIQTYTFQEPLPRSSKQIMQSSNNQQPSNIRQGQAESLLNNQLRDNSFDNFLKQNKKIDEFSVFSVRKGPKPSSIQQENENLEKSGFEFHPQQKYQKILPKQEAFTSESEVSQKITKSKFIKKLI